MNNKKKNRIIFLLVVVAAFFTVDLVRVKSEERPLFVYSHINNDKIYHVGLFYYYKEEISISPTQPLSSSPNVTVGPWFIPGITVYSSY